MAATRGASKAARPGPLRATSAATNRALALERGRGWAAADQRGGAGAELRPAPHLLAAGSGPDAVESPAPSGHPSLAPVDHEPPVPAQASRFHLWGNSGLRSS